ncbi:MAG: hypothetical protein ABH879_00875 [archaeon]
MKFIDLDDCVLDALGLFAGRGVPELILKRYKRPLVVGSGNAAATGRILFEDTDAVFADESTFVRELETIDVDGCVLISASGGKHAPLIVKELRKRGKEVILLTCNPNPLAKPDQTFVFPKQTEPYTYNTSTYMGMILAKTREDPQAIANHLKSIKIPDLSGYGAFFFIVPDEFDTVRELFMTKFDELFGPMINGRAFTPDQTEHAKTVTESDKELFISLGYDNRIWGTKRLNVPLPGWGRHATVMATGYYIIGKIQKANEPFFKRNIVSYAKKVSKIFGQEIKPIVE